MTGNRRLLLVILMLIAGMTMLRHVWEMPGTGTRDNAGDMAITRYSLTVMNRELLSISISKTMNQTKPEPGQ